MKDLVLWGFALFGMAMLLREVLKFTPKPVIASAVRRRYPPLPYIPLRPGFRVTALNPQDIPETVEVTDVSHTPSGIPQLVYFNGADGLPGVCHASRCTLYSVLPLPYQPGQRVQLLVPDGPVMRVEFVTPHADPRCAVAHCRDLDGRLLPQLVTCLLPYPYPQEAG